MKVIRTKKAKEKNPAEEKGNPVFRTAKGILKVLQNKIVASVMLLGQGILFLVSPSGDMKPTIRISAGLIILAALIMIFLSLGQETIRQYEDQLSLGGNLFLVNKEFMIGADYVPDDLVMPDVKRTSGSVMMRKEAAQALEQMFEAAKEEKINLTF